MNLSKNILAASAILSALSVSQFAQANVEDALSNICNVVKSNDEGELRKKMKNVQSDYKLRLGDYYDGISCDGQSLIRTAILNDAIDTGTLLVKKMPKSKLSKPETDGISLTAWISSNGKLDSAIATELNERL